MTGADAVDDGLRRATTADGDALNRLAREAYAVYVPIVGRLGPARLRSRSVPRSMGRALMKH